MSDLDKVRELCVDLGLEYVLKASSSERSITLDEGCDKVEAYAGFFATFRFRRDGSFIELCIGE